MRISGTVVDRGRNNVSAAEPKSLETGVYIANLSLGRHFPTTLLSLKRTSLTMSTPTVAPHFIKNFASLENQPSSAEAGHLQCGAQVGERSGHFLTRASGGQSVHVYWPE